MRIFKHVAEKQGQGKSPARIANARPGRWTMFCLRSTNSLLLLLSACLPVGAQSVGTWETLPNAPIVGRHNDVFFVNAETGWIVDGDGEIYKTGDGGQSWQLQTSQADAHFRSVGFVDANRGWVGQVGEGEFGATDTAPIYETADGGQSWSPVVEFAGSTPKGICGMNVVNDSVVVAVGRVRGPAFFVKTTDGGNTWESKDMSMYAAGLIDVRFFSPDSGFAVGLTNADHDLSGGVILFTSDGGETWENRFTTTRVGEWCWKISFPSRRVGYVSLQRNSETPIYFLKTTDGGLTWEEKIFSDTYYFVQGIGFLTEQVGWIGGNSSFPTFQTRDGGETWQSADFGARVNRFRFLSDTLGYAVGRTVYKFQAPASVGVSRGSAVSTDIVSITSNYPNPFRPPTTIRFELNQPSHVTVMVFDVVGRRVKHLVDSWRAGGSYEVAWDGRDDAGRPAAGGVYFYTVKAGNEVQSSVMVLSR